MSEEYYKKFRPTLFKHVEGQSQAINTLNKLLAPNKNKKVLFPHSLLITGPSGCGKTTIARILSAKLGAQENDYYEKDCTDFRGIEMVRDLRTQLNIAPIGKCRMYVIDECHQLTTDAQNALLKVLEDTPSHVYFVLCTTDPQKLKSTIITRCTEVKTKSLTSKELEAVIMRVCCKENLKLKDEVVERLVEASEGSARKALVLLNQIANLETSKEQIKAIVASDAKQQGIAVARALINPNVSWAQMATVLKACIEEPETIRHIVLGYCSAILLGNGNKSMLLRCDLIIDCFGDHFYDSKKAGLIRACREVVLTKRR